MGVCHMDERLALLIVGMLKSKAIEDAQRERVRAYHAAEVQEARHRAIKGRPRQGVAPLEPKR